MDRLTEMEAFVRVVDAGGFAAAARPWGRSRAVVSKYIAGLEARLGVQLIQRTTRSIRITDAGQAYYGRCVDLLDEIEALERSLRADREELAGTLRVTAPPGFATRFLPALTTTFRDRHPAIRLELELTHRMVDLVAEGFDVAVRVSTPTDSSLVARRLADAQVVAVAAPSYLAAHGSPETPTELVDHACLVDTNFRAQGRWRFRRADGEVFTVAVDGPFRIDAPQPIRDLAALGHGIALSPRFMVDGHLARGELVEVLAGQVAHDWQIAALYPRRKHLSARVRAYVDHLVAAFA